MRVDSERFAHSTSSTSSSAQLPECACAHCRLPGLIRSCRALNLLNFPRALARIADFRKHNVLRVIPVLHVLPNSHFQCEALRPIAEPNALPFSVRKLHTPLSPLPFPLSTLNYQLSTINYLLFPRLIFFQLFFENPLRLLAKSDTFRVVNRRVCPREGRNLPSFMGKTKEKQT